MNDLIRLIIGTVITVVCLSFSYWLACRISLLLKLNSLKKLCNAKISLQVWPFRPMWAAKEKADIKIEILNTVYLIRLYSGGGGIYSAHFANEEYSCLFVRLRAANRAPQGSGANSLSMSSGINIKSKVIHLPPFPIPPEYASGERKVVRVMLLNPAPEVLSYVTEEKCSIRLALTGDELYGVKVFTASSFVKYADRMMREEERLSRDNPDEYEFFKN